MNHDDARHIRDSLAAIDDVEEFGRRFYGRLFAMRPDARALFPADLDTQSRKLTGMLAVIPDLLDHPEALARSLGELGRRHARYGVREDDYDDVGAALLMSLHETLGEDFTEVIEEAWGSTYGVVAEIMIAAARGEGDAIR